MKSLQHFLYQIYKWVVFIPIFAVASIVFSIGAAVLSILFSPRIGSKSGAMWAKTVALFTPMRVKVHGREHIKKEQSYVIVSNHQSAYDIFALYGFLGIDFRWVMKKELRKAFFIGWASEKVGHIFLDRTSPKAALESIQLAKSKLVNGTSVVIFPEGTRSGSNRVRNFKSGAFKIAEDINLPILPITIRNTHKVYGGGMFNVNPGKVDIFIGKEINTELYKDKLKELMTITKEAVVEPIKEFNS